MCRLLATAGHVDQKQFISVSNKFRKLAHTGTVPLKESPGHKDGWGVAWYYGDQNFLQKFPTDAFVDERYPKTLKKIGEPDILLAHLRKVSVGKISLNNSHPFRFGQWSFCHNGTIYQSEKLKIIKKLTGEIKGNTDSEKFFFACLSGIDLKDCKASEFRTSLKKVVTQIRKNLDYSSLCSMFSNGKYLWVLREYNPKNERVVNNHMDKYLTIYYSKINKEQGVVACSQKIDMPGTDWVLMKNHQLLEYNIVSKKVRFFKI